MEQGLTGQRRALFDHRVSPCLLMVAEITRALFRGDQGIRQRSILFKRARSACAVSEIETGNGDEATNEHSNSVDQHLFSSFPRLPLTLISVLRAGIT